MTQDEIQAVARALAGPRGDDMTCAGYPVWRLYRLDAQAAIAALDAARGKAEPVAWMYIRRPEEWPPANPVVGLNQWKHDDPARPYWIETPLYAHPPADRVARVVEWLRKENGLCDCHARCETECGCGAWDDWKTKPLLEIADAIERGEPFNG